MVVSACWGVTVYASGFVSHLPGNEHWEVKQGTGVCARARACISMRMCLRVCRCEYTCMC